VVCDNVRSLANVGAIFRLCDAGRIERLYLCGITGHPPYPGDRRPPWVAERAGRVLAKTALRTIDAVPWEYRPSAGNVARELKARGAQVVALEPTPRSVDYRAAPYRFPLGVVLGHEREGVADPVLDLVDLAVAIPMYGEGTSLNVAMAFGIWVYEVLRHLPSG
jgi:tRNA G18 (ribose-2'-O)-methylase SpoU